ncbi:class I SAM-dependent methyltransferase [Luteithermobacter gelatinilyticus]|uniref:class I SAM-dependent methyltransferase n=1 Tax=Luteithermobacter gelatinilyticus TaxID=2582913 RepID=UPI001AF01C50|nr:class I SAM-dependent methyltransferase [Luteithermobacter gelatinilyticus]
MISGQQKPFIVVLSLIFGLLLGGGQSTVTRAMTLEEAIAGAHRSPQNVARDRYRHPLETLRFFGIEPHMTVVEIWPGGGGWYQEILAPYLRDQGRYISASYNPDSSRDYYVRSLKKEKDRLQSRPDLYGKVEMTILEDPDHYDIAPAGSADMVLSFRNFHNWMSGGYDEKVLRAVYKALKPGGIFGLVDHRSPTKESKGGYVSVGYVKELAAKVGFEFVAASEINANPKDTGDHEKGVWTLPPTLAGNPVDHARMKAIGESDRFTLKFRKPAH